MIRLRGKGITYGEIWFDEAPQAPLPDILICRQRPQPWHGAQGREFMTLLTDLTQDEAVLFSALSKDNRYEVRRAAAKDGATSTFFCEPANELDTFCNFYRRFAEAKQLAPADRRWLDNVTAAGRLVLTNAGQKGDVRVWHAYFVSDERVRLLYSASLFRTEDKVLQATIGRLNRWLHWQDMLEFKRRGFGIYDFGGIFSDESASGARGINRFKEEFGGVRSLAFDCEVALSWRGRIYLKVLKLRSRFRTGGAPA